MYTVKNEKLDLGKNTLVYRFGMAPKREVWIAYLYAVYMSVGSPPKFELSFSDIKAVAITDQQINHPERPAVSKMFWVEDLTIQQDRFFCG